ncbi:MAG: primosomal protein N' [Rhodocyclaceae bacterium]|nr:primosomal protein N' [Rhodocyclaceae bacterium]
MEFARVAVPVRLPGLFDYRLPAPVTDSASVERLPGRMCRVPFAGRELDGVIMEIVDRSDIPVEQVRTVLEIDEDLPSLPKSWRDLVRFVSDYYHEPLGEVVALALPAGWTARRKRWHAPRPLPSSSSPASNGAPRLTAEQQSACAQVPDAGYGATLLQGVTGSGKTEVYLSLIARTLAAGQQVLVLAPEINLAEQLHRAVSARLPQVDSRLVHSERAKGDIARAWLAALQGEAKVVVGTRLALFAPLSELGLIVVDEEHDASYKQQEGVRYHGRDMAVWRAHLLGIPIVLGSATPSMESYRHATSGRYRWARLPSRVLAANLPRITCIDTRREQLDGGITPTLRAALEQRLARAEQSLVFLNRRGYAPVMHCRFCGWLADCRHCAAHLVFHASDRRLRCHHCGAVQSLPRACPDCGNQDLQLTGRGTQRLEAQLAALFPTARIVRVDRDSHRRPADWAATVRALERGEADLLVGTQMLAKGHDFPKLTLVGIVDADSALFAADFRGPERLFAQLMQVAGRAGRAHLPGEVMVQTGRPDHPLYAALLSQDYDLFAREELSHRQRAGLPPYSFQALLVADAPALDDVTDFLARAAESARRIASAAVMVYDPVPMRLARRAGRERAQLLIESEHRPALQGFLREWVTALHGQRLRRSGLRWRVDVDPLEF